MMINTLLTRLVPLSLLLTLSITACQQTKTPPHEQTSPTNTPPTESSNLQGQQISSDNGQMTVTVPKSWSLQTDLNAQADLQVANFSEENYLVILYSQINITLDYLE